MFYQLGRQGRQSIVPTIGGSIFDRDTVTLNDAGFAQTFSEGIHQR